MNEWHTNGPALYASLQSFYSLWSGDLVVGLLDGGVGQFSVDRVVELMRGFDQGPRQVEGNDLLKRLLFVYHVESPDHLPMEWINSIDLLSK